MNRSEIVGAVGRAYCHPANAGKVVDVDLALAVADEIAKLVNSADAPFGDEQTVCPSTMPFKFE